MRRATRQVVAGTLVVALSACNSVEAKSPKNPDVVRYRLQLRDNPVSPREASHCFAECQSAPTPKAYVECLSQCPGFETTPGETCLRSEVPPVAACLTVRRIPASQEPPPGLVVLAVVGSWALVIAATSLCSVSSSQCGFFPPPQ